MINYRHLFFVVFLFFYGCVETLISVTIIPDGRYHVKIESQGDERDIKDKDFNLPSSSNWSVEEFQKQDIDSDETIFVRSAESLLSGRNFLGDNGELGSLRYPISVEKKKGIFSDTYTLIQIFEGRNIDKKYPMLSKSLLNPGNNKLENRVQTEIIMYCLRRSMKDVSTDQNVEALLQERILNHFNGVFFKAEEEGKLFDLLNEGNEEKVEFLNLPEKLVRTNFKPFVDLLPRNFIDNCINRMRDYLYEANVTIQLNDDTFKFVGTLPGVVFSSNADSISSDSLWWIFDLKDFMNESFTIEAASVVYYPQKIQQTIVLGALVILIVLFFIAKRKAKS